MEQRDVIKWFYDSEGTDDEDVFLDMRHLVISGGELGLLGLAFHPQFKQNGFFLVDYTAPSPLRTVIAGNSVDANDPKTADEDSEVILLEVPRPYSNHNGGQLAFGPDGYLCIALGGGGSAGDLQGNAQNLSSLLGKILRIDVDKASEGRNYSISQNNPFVGNSIGYKEEIYAYGLRNPWRFSFDPMTGWLWAGDVGQDRMEEVDIISKGGNCGWNLMKGSLCYGHRAVTGPG